MRSLKRTLIIRYLITVVLIVMMVAFALAFTIHSKLGEAIAVMVGLGILLIILGAVTIWTQRTLLRDLTEIGSSLRKIVVDNDLDRMPQPRFREIGELAQDIDTIAHTVRKNYRLLTQEKDRLQTILENISVGIIVVGRDLKTRMINPVAQRLLGITEEYAIGRTFTEIHHTPSIDLAIEKARLGAETSDEVTIRLPRQRTLKVLASPIRADDGVVTGVICILEDITPRRRLERIRRDFVANVSHELRTPIANMRAVVDALMAGAVEEPEAAERFIQDLDRESRRLADIIEDLLVVSRLETGKRDTSEYGSFVVSELLAEIVCEKAELAQKSEVTVELSGDSAGATFQGDRKLIKTACSNLLDNAIKYNRPGGRVDVFVDAGADEIEIIVEDTGIGIRSGEQKKIFERFYRVDKARSRETGGTGLGLSIVKHAAEFHGGSVRVASNVGEGSKFTIALPTSPTLF
ncbi:MAG: sensor histidine kinase [Candidatus Geothermincolia bacterium]